MNINQSNAKIFIGLFSFFWLIIVFLGYGYVHKPFSPEEFTGVLAAIWRTITAVILLSLAGGLGTSTRLREWDIAPLTKSMLASALGMGIISIFILIIGTTIGINFSLWVFLITAFIIFRKNIFLWWASFKDLKNFWLDTGKTGRIAILLITAILMFQYLEALAPPLQFDALTYHLSIPKAYIQLGRIAYLPDIIFWGMPQNIEMLNTLVMYLGGSEAAPVLGWWIGMLALIGITDFTKNIFEKEAAWVTAASLMAGSGLTTSISSGYVEWASILYGASVLICLVYWQAREKKAALILAGIFAGMALGTKYTNGVILIAGAVVILFSQKSPAFRKIPADLLWFGGAALATSIPWWIKNFLATSNPFYPLFIPSGAMDAILLAFYQFKPFAQDWTRVIFLPWQATIWGVDGGDGFSTSIGPLLLGLAPFAFISWRKAALDNKVVIKTSCLILLTGFLIWAIGSQFRGLLLQTRLYFIIFPAWALLAAAGYAAISKINSHNIRFGKIAEAVILLALAFNTFYTLRSVSASNPIPVILNTESRESYLTRQLGAYQTAMQMIETLPVNTRILMLWETRNFECLPKCDSDEIIGRWYHDWTLYKSSDAILASWKKQGYTHIMINRNGANFVRLYDVNAPNSEYWDGLEDTLAALIPIQENTGGYELYQLP